MFQQLNQYLFQFRALTLPHFGTIRLEARPARLDVAEHLIYAPAYEPQYAADEDLSHHQVEYFAAALQKDVAAVEAFFTQAGQALKRKIEEGAFNWSGVGTFAFANEQIRLDAQPTAVGEPVPAHRVLREKAQHSVLVGDQLVLVDGAGEPTVTERRRRDYWIVAAWVLAVLAALFIAWYFYQNHYSAQASGLQRKVQPAAPAPTWQ